MENGAVVPQKLSRITISSTSGYIQFYFWVYTKRIENKDSDGTPVFIAA